MIYTPNKKKGLNIILKLPLLIIKWKKLLNLYSIEKLVS